MSLAHSMNARKCVHVQKPYPSQAFVQESSKVRGRGEKETGKTEARRLMERKAAQQNKNISEELKQAQVNKAGGGTLPLATECDPQPPHPVQNDCRKMPSLLKN